MVFSQKMCLPGPVNGTLFGRIIKEHKIRSSWIRWALNPKTSVLRQEETGIRSREDGGKEGKDVSTRQGAPRLSGRP